MTTKTIKVYYKISAGLLPGADTASVTLLEDLNARLALVSVGPLSQFFTFDFYVTLETTLTEGDLVYTFKPFRNMVLSEDIVDSEGNVTTQKGQIVDFSTKDLNFSLNNPVDIEVQPSYDGTVNLILSDNLNTPRLINSRFSVTEGRRYYVVDRYGNKDTNLYDYDRIDSQTKLYKTINKVPTLEFLGLKHDGKLAVGNYIFYFKLADADDNETDIITESGIVSCHVGGVNDPTSIRGGMGNENSGKSVSFKFTNLDTNYAYLNVYYSRSTSDYSETEITSYYMISTKFSVTPEVFEFRITGYEPTVSISRDQINIAYNMIDRNKTAAQVQSRLFMANIHKTTNPYLELEDLSYRILPYQAQPVDDIGFLDSNYVPVSPTKCAYYDSKNVYNYTGYWDDEIYRLAIVYIMNDFSLSEPYSIRGRDFGTYPDALYTPLDSLPIYDEDGLRKYITKSDDGFLAVVDSKDILENVRGIVRTKLKNSTQISSSRRITPISFNIEIPVQVQNELAKYTKGFFITRQKRIPTIISQGFSIGHDTISGLPLIPEYTEFKTAHVIQGSTIYKPGYSTLVTPYATINKALLESTKYRLPAKGEMFLTFVSDQIQADSSALKARVRPGGALIVPDLILNSENLGVLFSGADFSITSANYAPKYKGFTRHISTSKFPSGLSMEDLDKLSSHFVLDEYEINSEYKTEQVSLLHIPEDSISISYNDNYFSSRAGTPEEAWKFSAFLKEEIGLIKYDPTPIVFQYNGVDYKYSQNVLVRGIFMSYVGMTEKNKAPLESAKFYNIRSLGFNEANMRDYFIVRANDSAPFYSASDRFSWEAFESNNRVLNVFRGDCFINQATIRVLRNFQDPELPTNDVVVNYKTLEDYPGYAPVSDILELSGATHDNEVAGTGVYKIVRSDVNANRLGYWVTLKFCSNINYAFRCVDPTYTSEFGIFGKPRTFFPLFDRSLAGNNKIAESTVMNVGYNSTTSDKEHYMVYNVPAIKNDFTNRIMFSEMHITDAFKNGYRIFQGLDYKDYTIEYGTITKIISWRNNLVVIFESGVGLVPINERTMAGQSEGENVYLRGAGVLAEKPVMLSQGVGSTWKDSIRMSQNYIYGVDTSAKKIWRTEGTKFEIFSEFKVQKFLNDNLDFTVYDRIPAIGLKNVVTHYNIHKYDVMFTFYDQTFNEEEKAWSLCFNEQLNNWTTRYSWLPAFSESLSNVMFTFSRGTCKVTSMISKSISGADGLGSVYIDSKVEEPLTLSDYLSLFYETKIENSLNTNPSASYALSNTTLFSLEEYAAAEFLDSTVVGKHPMYHGSSWNNLGYDKITVVVPAVDDVLIVYNLADEALAIAPGISVLSFYRSNNSASSIAGDELICNKYDGDSINNSVTTTVEKPVLKIKFHVNSTSSEAEANSLVKAGWTFNIMSLPSDIILLDTTEYLLTLQGKERYRNSKFTYTLSTSTNPIYDNNIFSIKNSTTSVMSIDYLKTLSTLSATAKYEELLKILSRIYFSLLVDAKVLFNTQSTGLSGFDQFRDVIYVRPELATITGLIDLFTNGPVPPLKPATPTTDAVLFTEAQKAVILEVLRATEKRYIANTTTDLWQHGNTNIFGTSTTTLPATWYGETHPFEFEFVVNGDELGIHKLFDNLKVVSNKAEPDSFEFSIVGDSYYFTKDDMLISDLNDLSDEEHKDLYIKDGYTLLSPAVATVNNKTKERGILLVQETKNIKDYGLRRGNAQYKEDMWEVQISPLRVTNPSNRTVESKLRDKYCKIRVKYSGQQLAIITALQTIYTLSHS